MYLRLFRLYLLRFTYRCISFDQVTVEFLLLSFHGGISSSIVAKKEDNSKVECKERRYSRAVGIAVGGVCRYGLLYQGTRHWFIEYRTFYVAYSRTCIHVYFVHLFLNSDFPLIYLIRSGDGQLSFSIIPRWDLFFHRCKERRQVKRWAPRTETYIG